MKTLVTGVGWINGAGMGCGRDRPFSVGRNDAIPKIFRKDVFHAPFPHFGRMDSYSRLGIAAIALALKDAGLDGWNEMRNIAVIASTVYGCLNTDGEYFDTVIPEGGRFASPNLFAYALPNTYLGEAAIHFGLTGAVFAINEPSLSGLSGLTIAIDSISRGGHEGVITGICDAGTPSCLKMMDRVIPGALFFILQEASLAKRPPYGEVTQNNINTILFDGKKVEDLNNLASMCTEGIHAAKEKRRNK